MFLNNHFNALHQSLHKKQPISFGLLEYSSYEVLERRVSVSIRDVTLRRDWKSQGFFRLSSVGERRRNAAWLRLGVSRSGGGKARNQRIHSCPYLLGGAMPVLAFMPGAKGRMAHTLRLASWKARTPASFEAQSWGTYPPGWRLFLIAIL
jgi:hypothetical protein